MIIISFYPKFYDENIDKDAAVAEYRAWLEQHGEYGRLFMWQIGKHPGSTDEHNSIIGIKIFEDEVGTLFKLLHEI
jgi:hypothetical protein